MQQRGLPGLLESRNDVSMLRRARHATMSNQPTKQRDTAETHVC